MYNYHLKYLSKQTLEAAEDSKYGPYLFWRLFGRCLRWMEIHISAHVLSYMQNRIP